MGLRKARASRIRALSIVLLPLLVSGLISTYLIFSVTSSRLHEQSTRFGQAVCDHLAISVTDHLINEDLLSLNILLTELLKENNFDFASVYSTSDALLAQAGKHTSDSRLFTQQVTFQDAITGYVQVGFNEQVIQSELKRILVLSIAVHLLLAALLSIVGWFYGDMFYLWIMQPPREAIEVPETETESAEAVIETSEPATTILVFKVRPSRLALTYRDKIEKALALYAGELDATEGDDIVIYFDKSDQLFQAICSGLLVLEIFNQANSPITIKAGMHQVSDSQVATDFETAKKHATYLASITEKQLLTSRHVREIISLSDQYEIQPFHSSMTPDGEVFCIDALLDQDLIDEQVNYLAKQD